MKHKQQGFATIYIVGILIALIGAAGTMVYMERQSMVKKVVGLEVDLKESRLLIEAAEKEALKLASVNQSLVNQLETQTKLSEAATEEAKRHQEEGQKIKLAFNNILKSLPKPVSKSDEPPESPQSVQVAQKRSMTLWEAFCAENLEEIACLPKGEKS